mgnify:CR=1 FL=1
MLWRVSVSHYAVQTNLGCQGGMFYPHGLMKKGGKIK